MGIFTRTRPISSNDSSTVRKNDGLPFVRGRKVSVNHDGRNISRFGRGSSKVEDNFEKFTSQNNNNNNNSCFGCINNRVWFFGVGVVLAICLYMSKSYIMIPNNNNNNNNNNKTSTTSTTTNGIISQKAGVMNKEEVIDNDVQVVPEIIDVSTATIPSPAPEKASIPDVVVPLPVPVPVPVVPATPPLPEPSADKKAAEESVDKAAAVIASASFPAMCTDAQLELIEKQLPNGASCTSNTGWHPNCSFRVATGGCQNPILARTFFANTNDFVPTSEASKSMPFTAVIVGYGNNNIPLDLLRIASGLDPTYNNIDWDTEFVSAGFNSNPCRTPIPTTTVSTKNEGTPRLPPRVLVIDWENPTSAPLNELKKNHDKELIIKDNLNMLNKYVDKKDSLTTFIQSTLRLPQPIHYLDLVGRSMGYDYTILMELMPKLLQNVRFVHFEYNKPPTKWSNPSYTLKDLIATLKSNGLICYWSGDEKSQYGLWRITDCFLQHYSYKNWSRIQCVSGMHDDVKLLATRMETQFLTTIQRKNTVFGGAS